MSTINWPINPQLNTTYTVGDKTWTYNGTGWRLSVTGKHADTHAPTGCDPLINYALSENISSIPANNKMPIADDKGLINSDWIKVIEDKLITVKDIGDDLAALETYLIMKIPGLVGYWSSDPSYMYEDSAGTIPTEVNGVIGRWDSMEIPAIQAITAIKPYLRKTPTSNIYWLDSNTNTSALTVTLGNLGSSCTIVRIGAEGIIFTEGVNITSTYDIAPAYNFNSDIAIFDRTLTVTEKALLTNYMQRGMPLLGDNLIVNGTFDNNTFGWMDPDLGTTGIASSNNGSLELTSIGSNYMYFSQLLPVNQYTRYLLAFDTIPEYGAGVQLGTSPKINNVVANGLTAYNPGKYEYASTITGYFDEMYITLVTAPGTTSKFDDIVLKQIL